MMTLCVPLVTSYISLTINISSLIELSIGTIENIFVLCTTGFT